MQDNRNKLDRVISLRHWGTGFFPGRKGRVARIFWSRSVRADNGKFSSPGGGVAEELCSESINLQAQTELKSAYAGS